MRVTYTWGNQIFCIEAISELPSAFVSIFSSLVQRQILETVQNKGYNIM